ncbi:putative expansin-A30 [Triticum dicoccoides]|uniref:Expansin n=1 Tax=Triticum turgidum subsp. durum TaxID=4567 RepID=A0A9R0V7Y9_TRITD|nr:putative expansin-A30 [Triticum dicoccoides]VAH17671.1 unnamed protein product [Triticum turgidum subsp. durum]
MASAASKSKSAAVLVLLVSLAGVATTVDARFRAMQWTPAHATFYGDEATAETMGGACGYDITAGYGADTAALSSTLFLDGYGCGTCYQIRCVKATACYRGSPVITVTATNLCPPNWAQDTNNGGWCNPPRTHFDLAIPAFKKMADWHAGIVPVMYRRVPCMRKGGIRFAFQGNPHWLLVYVTNVGGAGDVGEMWVKGSGGMVWLRMSHNWGASYQAFGQLGGQALSFKLTSYTTGLTIVAADAAPASWSIGLTYQARANFK